MVDIKKTKRLHIGMAYTYVGDTGIDIPMELLEGKTEEEQLEIACKYAQEHIDEIPVATNAEYIPYSDNFEICQMTSSMDMAIMVALFMKTMANII